MVNNDRYELINENISIYDDIFICSLIPIYGLIKINNDVIEKIDIFTGVGITYKYTNKVNIKYIIEKSYYERFSTDKKLTELEVFNFLLHCEN